MRERGASEWYVWCDSGRRRDAEGMGIRGGWLVEMYVGGRSVGIKVWGGRGDGDRGGKSAGHVRGGASD